MDIKAIKAAHRAGQPCKAQRRAAFFKEFERKKFQSRHKRHRVQTKRKKGFRMIIPKPRSTSRIESCASEYDFAVCMLDGCSESIAGVWRTLLAGSWKPKMI